MDRGFLRARRFFLGRGLFRRPCHEDFCGDGLLARMTRNHTDAGQAELHAPTMRIERRDDETCVARPFAGSRVAALRGRGSPRPDSGT